MKQRFYRIAESGGEGAGAGDPASSPNQPGAQGGDGGNADPNKSAASAAAKPEGSGSGAPSAQPTPPPATLEEALAQIAERDKRITDFEGKVKSVADEAKGTIKAMKEKFAGKINKIRSVKAQPEFEEGEEIKPRGADGKYTPKDLEEIQLRTQRRVAAELKSAQVQEAMDEYIQAFAKEAGMNEADLAKLDERVQSYRRLFQLVDGEKETDPVATPEEQVELFEDLIRGKLAPQLMEAEYKRGYADAERVLAAKVGEQGPTGGSPLPTGGGGVGPAVQVHPSAANAVKSFERLAG